MGYAATTTVRVEKSKTDIEKVLTKYGASQFVTGWDKNRRQSFVQFDMLNRRIRIMVPMPLPDDHSSTEGGRHRTTNQINAAMEQEEKRRWRCLLLIVKAKLEAVASNVAAFEEEFMPYIVTVSGRTIGEMIMPQLDRVAAAGELPPLLPSHHD